MQQNKQKPVPSDFYNKSWHDNNPFWIYGSDEKGKRRSEGIAPFLLMDTFDLWDKKVLDVGAGKGWLVKFLREFGADVLGLDYSSYSVENSVSNVILGDMTDLSRFEDNSFDMVISRENAEHLTIEQAEKAFSEIFRVTKKWVYITIWLTKDPEAKDDEVYTDLENDESHITVCTRKFWENKFQKFVDSGIIKERKDMEDILDWKKKGRVWVWEKL